MLRRLFRWLTGTTEPPPIEPQLYIAVDALRGVLCNCAITGVFSPVSIEVTTELGAKLTLTIQNGYITAYGLDPHRQFEICGTFVWGLGWHFQRRWVQSGRYYSRLYDK